MSCANYTKIYFLKNFFLPYTINPNKPEPRRRMVVGSGTGSKEFPPSAGSSGPCPITTGGMEGVDPEGGFSDPPPMRIGGMKGVGSEGGFNGASKTPGAGSSGDVFPCGTSDNTLAHRVLVNFVPSVINLSPFATFNLFFVQKISSPIRYETILVTLIFVDILS
jgi:hypothetical protein